MSFIQNREIELNKQFTSNPIAEVVRGAMMVRDMPLSVRIEFLAELIQKLDKLHEQGEETFGRNTFMGIGSSFAMAAAVATSSALNPLAGMLLSGSAVISWGGSMYEIFNENTKLEPVKDKLQRLSLALQSDETRKWAALWAFSGDDIFVAALEEASAGHVSAGRLIRLDKDTPLQKAIDIIGRYKGLTYDDVIVNVRGILEGKQPQIKTIPPQPQYQQIQQAPPAPIATTPIMQSEVVYHPVSDPTQSTVIQQPVTVLQQESIVCSDLPVGSKGSTDITSLILGSVDSLAFIGGQRCGKSLLMAIASRLGMSSGKFNGVFIISSLAKAGEDEHYWAHCKTRTFYDLADIVDKTPYYEKFLETIQSFKKTAKANNPQLLIIDEYAYLCERLDDDIKEKNESAIALMKELADMGSAIASGGAKRGWYIWVGSPQGAIGEMGRGGKLMKKLALCFCAIAPGLTLESNGTTNVVWKENLFNSTKVNFTELFQPPRGVANDLSDRIIFFNNKWYPKTSYELSEVPMPQQQPKAITPASVVTEDALMPQERAELNTVMSLSKPAEKTQTDILIEKIEQSRCSTLEGFIIRELKCANKLDEMINAIPMILERVGRSDLLGKFQD